MVVGLANHKLLISKDGKEIPIADGDAPIKNGMNEIIGVVLIFRDQTKEREAKRELFQSEEQFRLIFERFTSGKSLTLPDGKLSKVNQAFAEMLGYTFDEMWNLNFADLTCPDDMAESWECIRSLLADEKSVYRMEKRYSHKDGSIVLADVNSTLLRDERNNPLHLVTSIQDITHRKQSEELLRQS